MANRSISEAVFRLLLRAYPSGFRRRYERELILAFHEQRASAEYVAAWGAVRFWRDVLWDWARAMVESRRNEARTAVAVQAQETTSEEGWRWRMAAFRQDLAFAVRSLLRAPGFTVVAVLTLAIGIGSNAAMFAVVDRVLLEPLPYEEPDQVVTVWSSWVGFPKTWVSRPEYRAYLTQTRTLDDLAIWNETSVAFTDPENPERVGAVGASYNLVDVLGVEMEMGRFFTPDEAMRADSLPTDVIVISHEAWARRWGLDPDIIGTMKEMNGRQREVIGVLPRGFRLPTQFATDEPADLYFPSNVDRTAPTAYPESGGSHGEYVVGRVRDGATVEQARADIEAAVEWARTEFGAYPPERQFRPIVISAEEHVFGPIRPALIALLGTVGFVLLIACANIANLLLVRADARTSELAVRSALGADRGRLVHQLLVECLTLALAGGAVGLVIASVGLNAFQILNPGNLPRISEVGLDPGVLVVTAVVTLGTVLLFGMLPALRTTQTGLASQMGGRGERGTGRTGWQGTLVAVETALAVALVIGAGLMVRTFQELTAIEPGFDGDRTLTVAVSLPTTQYPTASESTDFYRELLRQVEEIPDVTSVGAVRSLPLGSSIGDWGLDVEGYDESINPRAAGDWQIAAPGYFETIGIPVVAGRTMEWSDGADSNPVAVVNEEFVRRFLGGRPPLGRTFRMGGSGEDITIVGVVGDVRHNGLVEEIKAKFYIPLAQWQTASGGNPTSMRLVVATAGDPDAVVAPVRAAVRRLNPSLAVAEVRTVDDVLSAAVAQPRFLVVLMSLFSGVAFLLALIGMYGVVSYGVSRRTREIGLRMALGAPQEAVVGLMVRKGASVVGIGLVAGALLALVLTRTLESQLYGISPTDPVTFGLGLAGFAIVAWGATYFPSRRAARIDPVRALTSD